MVPRDTQVSDTVASDAERTTPAGLGAAAAWAALSPGDRLSDRYRVVRCIGQGGQGAVYEVEGEGGQRRAAKLLHPEIALDAKAMARFKREAELASQVHHPFILRVQGLERTVDGRSALVTELLSGTPLDDLLRQPIELKDAIELISQLASALGALHRAGLVHRDVKPANVMVVDGPKGRQIRLMDFGIAKGLDGWDQTRLTSTGVMMGTPRYMAPEQIRDATAVDARTDLYALGVIAFEMLAGRPPFDAPSLVKLLTMQVGEPPPDLTTIRPELPPEVARVVHRALAKRPEERFESARQFELALRRAAAGRAPEAAHGPGRASRPGWVLPVLVGSAIAAGILALAKVLG